MIYNQKNQKGQALLIVLLMLTVVVMLGGAALALGSTVKKTSVLEMQQSRAYYAAEAGVEKALAEAKHNYAWIKTTVPLKTGGFNLTNDEKCLLSDNAHYPDAGDERVIESVRVIKTAEDTKNNIVDLRIQSIGRSFQSRKKITVDAKMFCAYPEFFFRGLWTGELSTLPEGHGVDFEISTYVSSAGLTIPDGSKITGNIFCNGPATFVDENQSKNTVMAGDIIAAGDVTVGDNTSITGNIYIDDKHTVTFGKNNVKFNGVIVVLTNPNLLLKMPPPLPDPLTGDRLTWYKNNASFTALPEKVDNTYNFQNGVYYIEPGADGLVLEGKYAGQATLIVDGKVSFSGNFTRLNTITDPVDCLAILATGTVETKTANIAIQGFIYSKTNFQVKNETDITGGVIAKTIDQMNGNVVHIKEDPKMLDAYKNRLMNTTNFVQLINWVD
jgi:predicted acyltransferase (DUF342 family)